MNSKENRNTNINSMPDNIYRYKQPRKKYYSPLEKEAKKSTDSFDDFMSVKYNENDIEIEDVNLVPNVFDFAQYIIDKKVGITTLKLQKLLFYCQAWSLVWDEKPLFNEKIEAWVDGPVIPVLFSYHKGYYEAPNINFANIDIIDQTQRETVDAVLKFYGDKSPFYLRELTHNEDPWILARKGLKPLERGSNEITLESMCNYYKSLEK